MVLDEKMMEKLHEIELEMLAEFIKVCKAEGLRYYLVGGSCIGAVRHKGFIPWDDDIDVGLPRKDYNRFLEIAQEKLPPHLFVQHGKTDPDFPMSYTKIRNSRTTFIENQMDRFNVNRGVFIDVFPLDGYDDSPKFQRKLKHCDRMTYLSCYLVPTFDIKKPKGLAKKIWWELRSFVLRHVLHADYRKYRDLRDQLWQQKDFDRCETVVNYAGAWGQREVMPRSVFGNGTEGTFEGLTVNLPEKTHEYLTRVYGDYMQLPPPEKRVSHHVCTIVDTEKPYTYYTNGK